MLIISGIFDSGATLKLTPSPSLIPARAGNLLSPFFPANESAVVHCFPP